MLALVVALLGGLVVVLGVAGVAAPESARAWFNSMSGQSRFIAAIAIRLGFGMLLWYAAADLRWPYAMRILAAIAFLAAVGILIMGRDRLDRLVDWWLTRPDSLFRVSMLFAAAFGGLLVYVSI